MESPSGYPESPMEQDDIAFPCKGCGEILEEGKAFELAGNRWHINCFRCNTCHTLLDSDANLLLLGDGSLICNNCTYSCSSCGNKIEDLAILTGDQAFCANCFKCRNCKRRIENLRYARTSQGIFCMDCHESLMARRRKKTARNAAQRTKSGGTGGGPGVKLDKSLPSLPPGDALPSPAPDIPTPLSEGGYSEPLSDVPTPRSRNVSSRLESSNGVNQSSSPAVKDNNNLLLPAETYKANKRHSFIAPQNDDGGPDEFTIPLAFDPTPPAQSSPQVSSSRDYFSSDRNATASPKKPSSEVQASPHIAYQEKGRQPSGEVLDSLIKRREANTAPRVNGTSAQSTALSETTRHNQQDSPKSQSADKKSSEEKFKLQDVPKNKRVGGSSPSTPSDAVTTPSESPATITNGDSMAAATRQINDSSSDSTSEKARDLTALPAKKTTPRPSYDSKREASFDAPRSMHSLDQSPHLPKRGDSLENKTSNTIPRKEVGGSSAKPSLSTSSSSYDQTSTYSRDDSATPKLSSSKPATKTNESPKSKGLFDGLSRSDVNRPSYREHNRSESISTMQSDTPRHAEHGASPSLPRYSAGGEFSLDEDMARIMGQTDEAGSSFLRRVSNSVRHGRSFSDKGMRLTKDPKWPKSPMTATAPQDISSPTTASPEHRDELAWFKNELRRERQKNLDRERRIAELESVVNSTSEIKQANSELIQKRSTMVVLDAQKEIVVRELEVLTERVAESKKSGEPFDFSKFSSTVLREFAESLQKLHDTYRPKIEELLQNKQELLNEISNLVQMKEKSFQEFEQLSLKNAQLAELNNTLVHQIQNLYKANTAAKEEEKAPANGLGIYSHHKEKSQVSVDSRELRPSVTELSVSGTTLPAEEAEPVTVLQGPQVVNIRKGQPKKFTWKKGQNVAKGVTKGLKGAFSSTQQSYAREMQFSETGAYGSTPPGQEYASMPKQAPPELQQQQQQQPAAQKGFGFFGNPKTNAKGTNPASKMLSNDSTSQLVPDAATTLFGSDLEARAQFEGIPIPRIITRCIEEVEVRGMDVEGIYRKSGGNSQILIVKEGFEKNNATFEISDPDLDIHAVTSGLKQYLRRLPTPLITYEVYDKILDSIDLPSKEAKVQSLQRAIVELPQVHQDVLEFLVFHLKRVVAREEDNLMTSMNIAVVFAPTIMRPESIAREMTDTQKKNEAVQFIVDNCTDIFLGNH